MDCLIFFVEIESAEGANLLAQFEKILGWPDKTTFLEEVSLGTWSK